MTEDEVVGWHHRLDGLDESIINSDMGLSKFREIVKDREAWHAAVHGYDGRIVKSGGKHLAIELEEKGYEWIKEMNL